MDFWPLKNEEIGEKRKKNDGNGNIFFSEDKKIALLWSKLNKEFKKKHRGRFRSLFLF